MLFWEMEMHICQLFVRLGGSGPPRNTWVSGLRRAASWGFEEEKGMARWKCFFLSIRLW